MCSSYLISSELNVLKLSWPELKPTLETQQRITGPAVHSTQDIISSLFIITHQILARQCGIEGDRITKVKCWRVMKVSHVHKIWEQNDIVRQLNCFISIRAALLLLSMRLDGWDGNPLSVCALSRRSLPHGRCDIENELGVANVFPALCSAGSIRLVTFTCEAIANFSLGGQVWIWSENICFPLIHLPASQTALCLTVYSGRKFPSPKAEPPPEWCQEAPSYITPGSCRPLQGTSFHFEQHSLYWTSERRKYILQSCWGQGPWRHCIRLIFQSCVKFARVWWEVDLRSGWTWSTGTIDTHFLETPRWREFFTRNPLHDRARSIADVFTQVFI